MKKTRLELEYLSDLNHEKEAGIRGLELISHEYSIKTLKLYKFKNCGHTQLIQPGHVRNGNFLCKTCRNIQQTDLLLSNGLQIIDEQPTDNPNYKLFKFLNCGHTKVATLGSAKDNEISCKDCQIVKIRERSSSNDFEFIRRCPDDYRYAFYKLKCGHERRAQIGNANRGICSCNICNASYIDNKSSVYLLKIKIKDYEILKIGFTSNIERRIKEISTDKINITIEAIEYFETGKQAQSFESLLHDMFKDFGLNKDNLRMYLKSGWSECYSVEIYKDAIQMFD